MSALLLLLLVQIPASAQQRPAWIEFSVAVSDNVNLLREQFNDREFPLCLEGRWLTAGQDRYIIVDDFRFPHMLRFVDDPPGVVIHPEGRCRHKRLTEGLIRVALFHTHPPGTGCYLSKKDVMWWLIQEEFYGLSITMCGKREASWWGLEQVNLGNEIQQPIVGQYVVWN